LSIQPTIFAAIKEKKIANGTKTLIPNYSPYKDSLLCIKDEKNPFV
jgi:hypothetical protein